MFRMALGMVLAVGVATLTDATTTQARATASSVVPGNTVFWGPADGYPSDALSLTFSYVKTIETKTEGDGVIEFAEATCGASELGAFCYIDAAVSASLRGYATAHLTAAATYTLTNVSSEALGNVPFFAVWSAFLPAGGTTGHWVTAGSIIESPIGQHAAFSSTLSGTGDTVGDAKGCVLPEGFSGGDYYTYERYGPRGMLCGVSSPDTSQSEGWIDLAGLLPGETWTATWEQDLFVEARATVPEPTTLGLLGSWLAVVAVRRRRQEHRS